MVEEVGEVSLQHRFERSTAEGRSGGLWSMPSFLAYQKRVLNNIEVLTLELEHYGYSVERARKLRFWESQRAHRPG
jgi:hypothetical protein